MTAIRLPSNPWKFIKHFIGYYKWPLFIMAIFEALQKACQILVPYAFKEILDGGLAYTGPRENMASHLTNEIIFFVAISIGSLIFARSSGAMLVYLGPVMRKLVRSQIYHYMQHHSQRYFMSQFAGSLANRVNEVSVSINHGLWTIMFEFWPVAISFSVSLYLLYGAHVGLATYLGVWILIYVGTSFFLARRCRDYARDFAAQRSKTTGYIVDAVTNVLNTKLFSMLPFERSRLDDQLTQELRQARRTIWFMEKMRWFVWTAALVLQVGLILYALKLFEKNELSIGNFAMVASLGLMIINDARGLSRRFLEFFEYIGNITDGVNVLIRPHEITDSQDARPLNVTQGKIQFQDVDFSYNGKTLVFQNLNVTIQPGEKVGLVGFSGSGKSTFANLILRMFDVSKGAILVDDQCIANCTQDSLREQVSMIPQDPMLFHRSLKENIRYGKLSATDEEVIAAAKQADAHEFIELVPEKYESLVGERGIKLSGGQRQRIAIARAILKNSPIIILDEATSSLDSVTEKTIQNTMETLMKDKTVIVVAHRLSTISNMDRILVFKQGQIVESGSHHELVELGGHYSTLWQMQAGGFLPEHEDQGLSLEEQDI